MKTPAIAENKKIVERKATTSSVQNENSTFTKILLACGIVSSFYYMLMNIVVPAYFPGYNAASQTVSELSAIGAPSRPLWVAMAVYYSLLVLAFGWGVWRGANQSRPLKVVGVLLLVFGASGFFWPPMHLRGEEFTNTDAMHIVFASVTIVLMMAMIGFGAAALGRSFRRYSFFTLAIFLVFGILTGIDSPNLAANLPTPWLGVWERINIGAWLLWVVVLAIILMKRKKNLG